VLLPVVAITITTIVARIILAFVASSGATPLGDLGCEKSDPNLLQVVVVIIRLLQGISQTLPEFVGSCFFPLLLMQSFSQWGVFSSWPSVLFHQMPRAMLVD
jgi:hypothetical protein